jgi:putative oxidoreductase
MKVATTIVRLLLGLVFLVFGLNGFLHFIPNMGMPAPAVSFFGALAATGYMLPLIFATQIIGGLLLLLGVFVPLALALLAPVVVNIFLFHLYLVPGGLPLAAIVVLFELFLVSVHRAAFAPMLHAR